MELLGVRVELPANTPILLLQETGGAKRVLPIYIGGPEAASIAYALEGVESPRPLTHDLLKIVLGELGATLVKVTVTELVEHTYYAELDLQVGDRHHLVSSRPSDAIALAVRTGTPIFADDKVLDEAGQAAASDEEEGEADEILEEFRSFIEHVSPDDFAS
jgi:uncharacterized protein